MKFCRNCGRDKDKNHLCDMVTLSDGRHVHRARIEHEGDLHEEVGKDLKIIERWITPEMREQQKKGKKIWEN